MSPIRRRTFFGQTSLVELRSLAYDRQMINVRLKNAVSKESEFFESHHLKLTSELLDRHSKLTEIGLAAEAELRRRLRREAEGREMSLGRRR
ncbi:hypothetical protein A2422_03450 [Candidatus Woesebacteria bacterium RIFOXYC1_FULL_31_51]|uniref:Uncharacterized protein n=1 Tax=Candidatus Woesebacteria bacterium GW2011_GWC2_31_9 TaxID=1618586 RepID=A0A0G0AZX2_9BACT|nr:MAG: hypothetical protein UR17_C0001G0197 [Candidatus Woesebacteria bacterium GW2011_GWF1_31_35]KKP23307.1 MAG: hypothetical protein UR11_C0001G0281 [Candidatus Woesebacteria bacterium GW2011_GWC1_30_29]KKP26175.1 MAG: hypothetical protein UR13_C0005G0058 [Candidatus Woesebacteria bacterium GW2011_GWD1_31_12]KKP27568.1 MAG: hypothetical protein UR16_C0003G0228 [Candidatus Woesebacteria bacterium GW2011_GWB1_31_29]KKP32085.1 MAG: hypothetical protein UR21_C0002G0004 [Candidatus Woesebacteria 